MPVSTFVLHLLALVAPAWGLSLVSTALARLVFRRGQWRMRWWVGVLAGGLLGSAILLAGLMFSGEDGRMLTYAALVLGQTLLLFGAMRRS